MPRDTTGAPGATGSSGVTGVPGENGGDHGDGRDDPRPSPGPGPAEEPVRGPGRRPRRRTRWIVTAVAVCLCLVAGLAVAEIVHRREAAAACAPDSLLVPPCGVWWGAYVPAGRSGEAAAVRGLESRIGRRLDVVYSYHDMSTSDDGQLITSDERALGADRILFVDWSSAVWSPAPGEPAQLKWSDIAAGRYDARIIDPQIERLKAYGRPVLFTFDQEADTLVGQAGTAAEYVAAYRHLYQRFQALGATDAIWVWTVTGYLGGRNASVMRQLYPGSAYVRWLAYDPYNYYTCKSVPTWSTFAQTVRPGYDWMRAHISASKPIMLAEYGTAADPADPAAQRAWYAGIPAALRTMPGIKAVVQWDSAIRGPNCDLGVDSPQALAGFTAAGRDKLFSQRVPKGD